MAHLADIDSRPTGLFVNPVGQRRVDFQKVCGGQFSRLMLADGPEHAAELLGQQAVDLLVLDLETFERSIDLQALGALVAQKRSGRTLLICPFASGGWLAGLMAFGPVAYAIGPLGEYALADEVAACLRDIAAGAAAMPTSKEAELRQLLEVRAHLQDALVDADNIDQVADAVCAALCTVPGVVHASLLNLGAASDLQLQAQHSARGLDLARLLNGSDRLMHSPLRHAFPGILAACSGEIALLDAPEKAGEPELASGLMDFGAEMVIGLPLAARGHHAPRGSVCLMFDRRHTLSPDQLAALGGLAQLAGLGLRMAEMNRDGEHLLARLTHMATTDALTGVANRRQGENVLELEIKRARRYQLPLALIGFDIDHFKAINDRYGHPVGDAALRTVAEVTLAELRASDVLARSGGEEFMIIVPHTCAIDALKMAEKLRLAISRADIPGCDHLTISLGVAQAAEHETADALMLRVDAALARAKRAGRNCVELAMA